MKTGLAGAVNDAVVRRLAGDRSFARGHEYFQQGQVVSLESDEESLRAVVRGGEDYAVTLRADDGILDYVCSCPQGATGDFCKHCVAAALAWLDRARPSAKKKGPRKPKKMTLADAAKVLEDEEPGALLRQIVEWAKDDRLLEQRLLVHAARRASPEAAVAEVERAFREAIRIRGGFLMYRQAREWARNVDAAIDSILALLRDGHAAAVVHLCEGALRQLEDAAEHLDDSDGHITYLSGRLQDLHLAACEEARPDPVALARRLLEFELHSEIEVFLGAAEPYAEVLGAAGLAEYRRLAEEEWRKVPGRTAEDGDGFGRHFGITQAMEALARASGDVEELVGVYRRDLSSSYNYLRIAQAYQAAGKFAEALRWAETGLAQFSKGPIGELRELAAGEYHRLGRHGDALHLMWKQFLETPSVNTYDRLRRHAAHDESWAAWREQAWTHLRARIAAARARDAEAPNPWGRVTNHSLLVEILLHEGDPEAAWQEARAGGCSPSYWLMLAAARERDHPEDAAPIYAREGAQAVAEVRNGRYEDAVALLEQAAGLMHRLGRSEEFARTLETLRATYRAKRNFTKLLDERRASLYFV